MVLAHNIDDKKRTGDIKISVDVTFDAMLLTNTTLEGLKNSGFYKPSPIQLHGIPLGKCGFDLFLEAKSGTGKTAVFTVIALEKLDLDKGLQSIILAPTREIAFQICDVIKQIGVIYKDLNVQVVMGGLPIENDIQKLKSNVHILVGSPGRLRYLIQDKHVEVSAVRLLVLDEADKLMHRNFQADINYIFSVLPKDKQVIMSSATYPDEINSVMQNYVQQAQHICPDSTSILLGIKQLITTVTSNINIVTQTKNKFKELLKILSNHEFKQCLIFCNYQARVGELCKMLKREKWPAQQLHGQLEQNVRLDALKTLQEYKCRILVSSDLAARGIDASNVDLVVNFEPPVDWQTYLHRIGRAGRFGSYGTAITILSEGKELTKFKDLIRSIKSSLNLTYLWDNSKFELDDLECQCPSLEEPEKVQVKSEEIITKSEIKDMDVKPEVKKQCGTSEKEEMCKTLEVEKPSVTQAIEEIYKVSKVEENCNLLKLEGVGEEAKKCKSFEIKEIRQTTEKEAICQITEEQIKDDRLLKIPKFEKINNSQGFQDFAQLFDSFEKSKECNIESFDDLITSFNIYEPNNNEKIDIQDVTLKKYFDSVSKGETEPYIILQSNSDSEVEVEQHLEKEPMFIITSTSANKENHLNKNLSASHIQDRFVIKLENGNLKQVRQDKENCLTSSQRALKNAGLPTSFSSTKSSTTNLIDKPNMLNFNQNITHKQKLNNGRKNESDNNNRLIETKHKTLKDMHLTSSIEASPASMNDDGYNTHSCLFSRSTKYVPSQNKGRGNSCSDDKLSSHSKRNSKNEEINSNIYIKYMTWYSQMKSHIKQVEMSLYVEELSKV